MDEDAVRKRGYAKTSEEWWFLLADQERNITRILGSYLNQKELRRADKAFAERNMKEAWRCLQTAWERAPDSPWIHQVPGWSLLCDLCSDCPFEEDEVTHVPN